MTHALADLVISGNVDEALRVAGRLNPATVWAELFDGSNAASNVAFEDPQPFADFIVHWYNEQSSPFMRAEIGAQFSQTFLTELAPAESAELIGAHLATGPLLEVLVTVADAIEGDEFAVWSTCPEKPLEHSLGGWFALARDLRQVPSPGPVPLPST